nr:MAG TPA: hypothetical protein [Caudoviricetes sp.]
MTRMAPNSMLDVHSNQLPLFSSPCMCFLAFF